MITHDLKQGSPAWDQFRLQHFGASEAAAMLSLSPKVSRNELLRMKKTGLAREFSEWFQEHILGAGHRVEGQALPHAENFIGDDLYAATCSDGLLSASCDGLTMSGETAWEHKQANDTYFPMVQAGQVPDEHMPQCQQVLLVTGAKRLVFTMSDGTPDRMAHVEVLPDPDWFDRLRAGWAQFEQDLTTYEPTTPSAPAPAGHAPDTLPALLIEVTGAVTASNLDAFKAHAEAVFKGIKRDLKTDQDFADADKTVKWCKDAADRLKAAKAHALAQTESIDLLFRTIDDIVGMADDTRLELKKLVDARKAARKQEILTEAQTALGDHLRALNKRLGRDLMPQMQGEFAAAIAGKRSFDSMQDAVDGVLANAKIAANATADRIDANLKTLAAVAPEHAALFPDSGTIALKQPDDLQALVRARVAEHDAAVQRRAQEAAEQEREKIRKQEAERVEREQREARERAEAQERAREDAHRAEVVALEQKAQAAIQVAREEGSAIPPALLGELGTMAREIRDDVVSSIDTRRAIAKAQAAAPMTPPSLKLGTICARLQHCTVTADNLRALGFEPAAKDRGACLYHERDFPRILAALVTHIESVQAQQAA